MTTELPRDGVQSLARGLAVLTALGEGTTDSSTASMSLSDVARATGLTRAAARRFLLTLVELGYVRGNGRRFALRPRVLELGEAYLRSLRLPETALKHMQELARAVKESCSLAVLDTPDVVYVQRAPGRRRMTARIEVGTRLPAQATSMGRVLLADLDPAAREEAVAELVLNPVTERTLTDPAAFRAELVRVREQGYCIVDGELEQGIQSLAVPVRGASRAVTAALNVPTHASPTGTHDVRRDLLPTLIAASEAITSDLARAV
jgi:IclR family transcriptional regulator, pca regulon regulatory protein